MKNIKKITLMLVVAFVGLTLCADVKAAVINDNCTITGYTFMGASMGGEMGLGFYDNRAGEVNNKDYFLAQPLSGVMGNPGYWGYGWVKFDSPTETVDQAFLVLEQIDYVNSMMGISAPSVASPLVVDLYAASIDVENIGDLTSTPEQVKDAHINATPFATLSITSAGLCSVDITDVYNSWVGGVNNGIIFSGGGAFGSWDIDNGQFPGASVPYISDTFVPEPATMLLLCLGSLVSLRKRK